jgi:hypothetical protein
MLEISPNAFTFGHIGMAVFLFLWGMRKVFRSLFTARSRWIIVGGSVAIIAATHFIAPKSFFPLTIGMAWWAFSMQLIRAKAFGFANALFVWEGTMASCIGVLMMIALVFHRPLLEWEVLCWVASIMICLLGFYISAATYKANRVTRMHKVK